MQELRQALEDITDIRRQMAQSTQFRGYGPAALLLTGVLAWVAAIVQACCISAPAERIRAYLALWILTAVLNALVIFVRMRTRARQLHSYLAADMIRMAIEQFLPIAGAGMVLTLVITLAVPVQVWMLPGLWQIFCGLGIFASCRFLPRRMALVAAWYELCGLFCILLAGPRALAPWTMGVAFGVGQSLTAAILYFAAREDES